MFLILLVLVVLLYVFDSVGVGPFEQKSGEKLLGKLTLNSIDDNGPGFILGDVIERDKLIRAAHMDYEEFKKELGLEKDFVITLQDDDGNVILIDGKYCIGSPKAKVAGRACG